MDKRRGYRKVRRTGSSPASPTRCAPIRHRSERGRDVPLVTLLLDVIHRLVAALHSIWLALVFGLPLTLAFADNEQGKTPVRAEEEQSVRRL